MKAVKQKATAIVMSGLLMCSCSPAKPKDEAAPAPAGKTLVMEVDSGLGADVLSESGAFAKRVEKLSGGALKIDVKEAKTDTGRLSQGGCDLAFLSSAQAAQADDVFAMLSLPFLYDDASHMSLALNSTEMAGILTRKLAHGDLTPMAAIYNGSRWIVTDKGLLRIPSDFKKLILAADVGQTGNVNVFQMFGTVIAASPAQPAVNAFNSKQEVKDQSGKPIGRVDAAELTLEQVSELLADPQSLFLIRTSHAVAPIWLLANAKAIARLSDYEQAVLKEATAGLIAEMEEDWHEKEQDLIQQFKVEGITIVDAERPEFAAAVYDNSDSAKIPTYFDRQIYRIIQLFVD